MVKWGVISTGTISKAFCDSIRYSKEGKLVAVASRSSKNLKHFSDKYGVATYDSYDALLNDSAIDAIYIGTPHSSHFDLSLKTLRCGKHLLCEKPMTMNSTEAMILLNEARRLNLFFMEAFMYRCHPLTHKMLELVKQEFSGQEVLIESSFGFSADVDDKNRLKKIFNSFQPDIVINFAAQAGVRYSLENPEIYINVNSKNQQNTKQ